MSNQSKYPDPTDDPAYHVFVESMVQYCKCEPLSFRPCDGVLAGGLCDQINWNEREEGSLSDPDEDY
jgi:hypothetical protein